MPDFYVVHGISENASVNFIVSASGGVLASGVLIVTLLICRNLRNETKAGISTWIIWQLTNAVFEALIPSFYIQNLTLLAVTFFPTSYLLARTLVSHQK